MVMKLIKGNQIQISDNTEIKKEMNTLYWKNEKPYVKDLSDAVNLYVLADPYYIEKNNSYDNSYTYYPIHIITVENGIVKFLEDTKPRANLSVKNKPLADMAKRKWYIVPDSEADIIRERFNKPQYIERHKRVKNVSRGTLNDKKRKNE